MSANGSYYQTKLGEFVCRSSFIFVESFVLNYRPVKSGESISVNSEQWISTSKFSFENKTKDVEHVLRADSLVVQKCN